MRSAPRMPRASTILIALAFTAGLILRLVSLSGVPPSLYCDEAFQGYEAYSLLQTGADSHGRPWPLFFDIFGVGWEEPLYIYLTMIPVALLGTTPAATRAVAALAGALAILAVAWLATRLAGRWAGAAAALSMAFSPWAFHFSRVGFQASLLPLFLAAGAAALLEGVRSVDGVPAGAAPASPPRSGWIALGLFLLVAALYTYVASRAIVPLLIAAFGVIYLPSLRRLRASRKLLLALALLVPALPLVLFASSAAGMERFQDVGLVSRMHGAGAVVAFLRNYLTYFSPSFLLTHGDPNLRHSAEGYGMLLPHDLVLLLAGLVVALIRRRPPDLLMCWWLLVAPLGAALTADPSHAVRAIGMIPAIYVLAGSGAAAIFGAGSPLSPRRRRGAIVLALFLASALVSAGLYLHHYFVRYPVYSAPAWQYGLEQAYEKIEARAAEHDSIYVTRAEDFPWIQRLYLFAFPPAEYQKYGFSKTRYLFDEPVFYRGGLIPGRSHPIFLLKPGEVEASGLPAREVIRNPDGTPAFVIAW